MFEKLKGKKLYRSPKNGLLFGITSGIARYLDVDVVFVRLALILLAVITGFWPMVLIYAIAVFLMPIDPAQATVATHQEPKDVTQEKPSEASGMDRDQNI